MIRNPQVVNPGVLRDAGESGDDLAGCRQPELGKVNAEAHGRSLAAVISRDVVDAADGWPANSGVVAVMVVGVQEPVKGSCTLSL